MNDQPRNRRLLLLAVIGVLILIIGGSIYLIGHKDKHSPFYTTKIVDQDTGEVLYIQPNQGPEGNAANYIHIFGSKVLFDDGATQGQFQLIQQFLTSYNKTKLAGKYQTLTLIPKNLTSTAGNVQGQLRLGETPNILGITIKLSQLKYVQISIKDSSGQNGGDYDSGQLFATN